MSHSLKTCISQNPVWNKTASDVLTEKMQYQYSANYMFEELKWHKNTKDCRDRKEKKKKQQRKASIPSLGM